MSFIALFIILTILWLLLVGSGHIGDRVADSFGSTYGFMALLGGIYGIWMARTWGLFRSFLGRAILFLSFGLLFQEFGQLVFTYLYIVKGIEVPYPSIADIGFFGAIPMSVTGAIYLMKGLGGGAIILKNPIKLAIGILVPLIVLSTSYWFFLAGYDPRQMPPLNVFLDLGYPLGQAIFVSITLVTLLSTGRLLGGAMRKPILLLLFACTLQYIADFNFLFQSSHETWVNGGYGDYLYLLAYFVMGVSLIYLSYSLSRIFSKRSTQKAEK